MVDTPKTARSRSPTRKVNRVHSTRSSSRGRQSLHNSSHHSQNSKTRSVSRGRGQSLRNSSHHSQDELKRGTRPSRPRGRSGSPGMSGQLRRQPPGRTRSFGLERNRPQDFRQARSASPSLRSRARSTSSSRNPRGPARTKSYNPADRNQSRSRSLDRFSDENHNIKKVYPSQRPEDNFSKRALKSFRLKKIRQIRAEEVSWCKVSQYIVPLVTLLCASVGLIFATGNGAIVTDAIDKVTSTIENSELLDPNSGSNTPHWPENGNGLRVTIINALTEDWDTIFNVAIGDWGFGDPDAIEITEEKGTPDPDCEASEGFVVVCNGNYGDLKWRGVNLAMLDSRGNIVSSSAKMNEYYLSIMEKGAWQYTMCHEIGHTLGLGHTDEDFDNEDLGNCMDYTDNLDANKHPDASNYEKLYSIYGPISRRQLRRHDSRSQRTEYYSRLTPNVGSAASDHHPQISEQRLRKRNPSSKDSPTLDNDEIAVVTVTEHIRNKKNEAVQKLYQRIREYKSDGDHRNTPVGHTHSDGWKLVHRRHKGEEHEMDLGGGFKVRAQFLLVH